MAKHNKHIVICLIFIVYTLGTFGFYYERTLQGNISNHILPAELFGVPKALKARGIEPLYHGAETGWDGQFYYYMSNDLLGIKDTAAHIDSPSYRYQRIGLSLYSALIAKITARDWVSPKFFFLNYFFLILVATWFGARLFDKLTSRPVLILLWSLCVGTQITLFNALPDAAADAFLILALSALFEKKYLLSLIPFTFSALSREIYVLFPSFIFLFFLLDSFNNQYKQNRPWFEIIRFIIKGQSYYLLLLPGLITVGWHIYVTLHFGMAPGKQAYGIIESPLFAWFTYFKSGLYGKHLLVGTRYQSYSEALSLLFFLAIILCSLVTSLYILIKRFSYVSIVIRGLAFTTIILVMLYACFGPVVMMHYSGYLKALGVFFFLLPVLSNAQTVSKKINLAAHILLTTALLFTSSYNVLCKLRLQSNMDQYTKLSKITKNDRIECFNEYNASVDVQNIAFETISSGLKIFNKNSDKIIIHLLLKNTGKHTFVSTHNFGSVFMSSHWVDADNKVIQDGIRSAIPNMLQPGESTLINVVTSIPQKRGTYFLKLSPVQEGCAWFYRASPQTSLNLAILKSVNH